jgi:hypothetical protein
VPSAQTHGADDDAAPPLRQRLNRLFLKPVDPATSSPAEVAPPPTVEELEYDNRYANDKERIIGLLAAPLAAIIGILIISSDIAHDPAIGTKLYVPVSTYHWLMAELLVLSVAMLAAAWFRKRLYLGFAMALYGLSAFNLHWWGFGVPYILFGSWYLVRAYRSQKALKEATGVGRYGGRSSGGGTSAGSGPQANKRYTPPSPRPKRSSLPKSEDE